MGAARVEELDQSNELDEYIAVEGRRSAGFARAYEDATELDEIAQTLLRRRKARRLTQARVAKAMGVEVERVAELEDGELLTCPAATLQAYARAVGLRVRLSITDR